MRKTILKFTVAAILVAATAMTFAQGGGGGGGRGGFGQGRMGMGGMDRSGLSLLGRADVQKDLNITADQKAKIEKLQEAQRDKMQAMMEEMRNGGGFDREAMQKAMEKNQAEAKVEVDKILDDKQKTRLGEIRIQLAGNRAIMDADTQKALGMSAEQVAKVKKLNEDAQAANQAVMERMRNQEIDREAFQAAMQKNNETLNTELGKILTAEQAAKLKEMGGAPFKADPQQNRGGGAGRGTGGGGGGRGGSTGGGIGG